MQAELVSLSSKGKLRIICEDVTGVVFCDPNDHSTSLLNIDSQGGNNLSLGTNNCIAQVADPDDLSLVGQQLNWGTGHITQLGAADLFEMQTHDLGILSFTGYNGAYLVVEGRPSLYLGFIGRDFNVYAITCNSNLISKDTLWFPKIPGSGFEARTVDLPNILRTFNITLNEEEYHRLLTQIS